MVKCSKSTFINFKVIETQLKFDKKVQWGVSVCVTSVKSCCRCETCECVCKSTWNGKQKTNLNVYNEEMTAAG